MSRKKEKKEFFEVKSFENSTLAQEYLDKCNRTHKLNLILTGVSVIGTLGILLSFVGNDFLTVVGDTLGVLGIIAAIIVGKLYVIKFPLKLAKFCWYICPFFPIDLMLAPVGFLLGLMCLVFAPLLISICGLVESRKNCKAAEEIVMLSSAYSPNVQ